MDSFEKAARRKQQEVEEADTLATLRGRPEYQDAFKPEYERVLAGGEPYAPSAGILGTYTPSLVRSTVASKEKRSLSGVSEDYVRALALSEAGESAVRERERAKEQTR